MSDSSASLSVGDVHSGPVTSVKRFGVFVAVGGVEGLVDGWWLQRNVEVWPKLGETVTVRVDEIREDGKVTLSLVIPEDPAPESDPTPAE